MSNKAKILRALQFARVIDENNNLSLTNFAVVITLVRLLQRPDIEVGDLFTFLVPLLGYQAKRMFSTYTGGQDSTNETEDLKAAVASLQTSVTALKLGQGRPR